MKKLLCVLSLLLALALAGCPASTTFMVGSLLGGAGTSYGKAWLDKYLTPESPTPPKPPDRP